MPPKQKSAQQISARRPSKILQPSNRNSSKPTSNVSKLKNNLASNLKQDKPVNKPNKVSISVKPVKTTKQAKSSNPVKPIKPVPRNKKNVRTSEHKILPAKLAVNTIFTKCSSCQTDEYIIETPRVHTSKTFRLKMVDNSSQTKDLCEVSTETPWVANYHLKNIKMSKEEYEVLCAEEYLKQAKENLSKASLRNAVNKIVENNSKIKINYVLTIGRRCNSTDYLRLNNLTKFSSPFDWLIVDFDSALELISKEFSDFTQDILIYKHSKPAVMHKINDAERANKHLSILRSYPNIIHFNRNFNKKTMRYNLNYVGDKIDSNLYSKGRSCNFMHHDVTQPDIQLKLKKRTIRMNELMKNKKSETLLFYLSIIVDDYVYTVEHVKNTYEKIGNDARILYVACVPFEGRKLEPVKYGNMYIFPLDVPSFEEQCNFFRKIDNYVYNGIVNFNPLTEFIEKTYFFDLLER